MRRTLSGMLAGLLVSALLVTAAFAEDVCVTKHGKRYHKEGSRFLKGREFEVISREEAEARGYKPSSEFFRDDAAPGEKAAAVDGASAANASVNQDKGNREKPNK